MSSGSADTYDEALVEGFVRLKAFSDLIDAERPPTGLDAPYYDIPPTVKCIQDAVEYLNLNFANGNILKSLWREHGAQTKNTDALYEAEKRFYFAKRELERVRNLPKREEAGGRLPDGPKGDKTP